MNIPSISVLLGGGDSKSQDNSSSGATTDSTARETLTSSGSTGPTKDLAPQAPTLSEPGSEVVSEPAIEPLAPEGDVVSTTGRPGLTTKTSAPDSPTTIAASNAAADDTNLTSIEKDTSADMATKDATTQEAVEHDTVKSTHTEEVQNVINKEKHQDHYHTTVQPLVDQEIKPEEHDFKTAETENRVIDHENSAATRAKLEAQQTGFTDSTTELETKEKKVKLDDAQGEENIHHHYHETIQPVIEKEVIRDSVTHTKVPVHETHQEASVVHEATTAAPVSVSDFKKQAGTDAVEAVDAKLSTGTADVGSTVHTGTADVDVK